MFLLFSPDFDFFKFFLIFWISVPASPLFPPPASFAATKSRHLCFFTFLWKYLDYIIPSYFHPPLPKFSYRLYFHVILYKSQIIEKSFSWSTLICFHVCRSTLIFNGWVMCMYWLGFVRCHDIERTKNSKIGTLWYFWAGVSEHLLQGRSLWRLEISSLGEHRRKSQAWYIS